MKINGELSYEFDPRTDLILKVAWTAKSYGITVGIILPEAFCPIHIHTPDRNRANAYCFIWIYIPLVIVMAMIKYDNIFYVSNALNHKIIVSRSLSIGGGCNELFVCFAWRWWWWWIEHQLHYWIVLWFEREKFITEIKGGQMWDLTLNHILIQIDIEHRLGKSKILFNEPMVKHVKTDSFIALQW